MLRHGQKAHYRTLLACGLWGLNSGCHSGIRGEVRRAQIPSSCSARTSLPVPPAPATATGKYTNKATVTFSWPDIRDVCAGAELSFHIQVGTSKGDSDVIDRVSQARSISFTGANGATYFSRIAVIEPGGESPFSDDSEGVTVDSDLPPPPAAPLASVKFSKANTFTFKWGPPAGAEDQDVAVYAVKIGTSPDVVDVSYVELPGTSTTVTGENGITYYAKVRLVDFAGNVSEWSASSTGVLVDTASPYPPVAPVTASHHSTSTHVDFAWLPGIDRPNGSGVASYNANFKDLTTGVATVQTDLPDSSATLIGHPGDSYQAQVQAVDAAGNLSDFSTWSETVSIDASATD